MTTQIIATLDGPDDVLAAFMRWWEATHGCFPPLVSRYGIDDVRLSTLLNAVQGVWWNKGMRVLVETVEVQEGILPSPYAELLCETVRFPLSADYCSACGTVDPEYRPSIINLGTVPRGLHIFVPLPLCVIVVSSVMRAVLEPYARDVDYTAVEASPEESGDAEMVQGPYWIADVRARVSLEAAGTPIIREGRCSTCGRVGHFARHTVAIGAPFDIRLRTSDCEGHDLLVSEELCGGGMGVATAPAGYFRQILVSRRVGARLLEFGLASSDTLQPIKCV